MSSLAPDEREIAELTTSGRMTGAPHHVEIWFATGEECVYLLSGGGDRADWVRNIMVSPDVVLEIGDRKRTTTARIVERASDEDVLARSMLLAKYTAAGHLDLADWAKSGLVVRVGWPD